MEIEEEERVEGSNNKGPNPLLNDVVLRTLVPYIHPGDMPTFRNTCTKWHHSLTPRFKKEFTVDLTGHSNTLSSRKMARFIYDAMKPSNSSTSTSEGGKEVVAFESFKISETKMGVASLDRVFLTQLVPHIRRLQLVTKNKSLANFWALLGKLEKLEELELDLKPEIGSEEDMSCPNGREEPKLEKLKKIKWVDGREGNEEEQEEGLFSMEFLNKFYSIVEGSWQYLGVSLPRLEAWRHLMALNSNSKQFPRRLSSLQFFTLTQRDLQLLDELYDNHGLRLQDFRCSSISADVRPRALDNFFEKQAPSLKSLQIGWTTRDRTDLLEIKLPDSFPKLQSLTLKLASKIRYQPINFGEKFPLLKELCVVLRDVRNMGERVYFWEDLIHARTPVPAVVSLWKLELVGVPLRSAETLYEMLQLFPNVRSLTLGRPSKHTLFTLWSLWPNLKELKIITACPQIDEVLTGIPNSVCKRLLMERNFDDTDPDILAYLKANRPSIRDLKHLQRLEINAKMNCRLQTLSCLPSDIPVYFAFMKMPELRRVIVHRSLISSDACFHLQRQIPSWGTVKVEQVRLHFDESIDAFHFHQNNHRLMRILCRYPHQSLDQLPNYFTSLWMGRDL